MAKAKKKSPKRRKVKAVRTEKEPEFMVNLPDPKALRKDILESLREIIIFMQGYENFRQIQEEKVVLFAQLKKDVKELQSLFNNKLRKFLPKGKLALSLKKEEDIIKDFEERPKEITKRPMPKAETPPPRPDELQPGRLGELEDQLKDIEQQLQGLH